MDDALEIFATPQVVGILVIAGTRRSQQHHIAFMSQRGLAVLPATRRSVCSKVRSHVTGNVSRHAGSNRSRLAPNRATHRACSFRSGHRPGRSPPLNLPPASSTTGRSNDDSATRKASTVVHLESLTYSTPLISATFSSRCSKGWNAATARAAASSVTPNSRQASHAASALQRLCGPMSCISGKRSDSV